MTDPTRPSLGDPDFLTVRVAGAPGLPERLLLIGRPDHGMVHVREWTTATMNTEGDDYDIEAGALLESLEEALAAQRQVSEEMYRIRRWLAH